MKSVTRFITHKLKLQVNKSKSAVLRPERKFLGFSFTDGPEIKRAIAPQTLERFKKRIREITRRAKSVSLKATIAELVPYILLDPDIANVLRPRRQSTANPTTQHIERRMNFFVKPEE